MYEVEQKAVKKHEVKMGERVGMERVREYRERAKMMVREEERERWEKGREEIEKKEQVIKKME